MHRGNGRGIFVFTDATARQEHEKTIGIALPDAVILKRPR
jgi:hypothetical protein